MKYVIDRFEGKSAICEDENRINTIIPLDQLPAGITEGDIVSKHNGLFMIEQELTSTRKKQIEEKMMRLYE